MWTGAGYRTNQMLWSPPPPLSTGMPAPHGAGQSPVPFLFGGLAAILVIIAFCLLMLAFSYWKLPRFLQSGSEGSDDPKQPAEKVMTSSIATDQFVVIMAGDQKPTFMACRADASFGDNERDVEKKRRVDEGRKL